MVAEYINELKLLKEPSLYETISVKEVISTVNFLRPFYKDNIGIFESSYCLFLNRANDIIGWSLVSNGGTTGTTMDIKLIAVKAIKCLAQGIIISHNHPSGNIYPSESDKEITRKFQNALKLLDMTLIDHIILTEKSYYSFADNGIL